MKDAVLKAIEVMTLSHSPRYVKKPENAWRKSKSDLPFAIHPLRVMRKVNTYLTDWVSSEPYRSKADLM